LPANLDFPLYCKIKFTISSPVVSVVDSEHFFLFPGLVEYDQHGYNSHLEHHSHWGHRGHHSIQGH
jgi:hypothetical protein